MAVMDICAARVATVAVVLALAGCGGGGGGGSGDRPQFEGRLSDISEPFTVAPAYAHMVFCGVQCATTTRLSEADPQNGLVLDVDPLAGTVTIDSPGLLPQTVALDFDNDSVAFGTGIVGFPGGSVRATMLIPGTTSGYHYASYGVWSYDLTVFSPGGPASRFQGDTFYFGSPTGAAAMPDAGEATYHGTMRGIYSPQSQHVATMRGDATLVVNFGADTVTGSFHDIEYSTLLGSPAPTSTTISVNAQISGNGITGTVCCVGGLGTIDAGFFGPDADEMAGVFRTPGAIGAFAAQP